jgi:hypothetical protein
MTATARNIRDAGWLSRPFSSGPGVLNFKQALCQGACKTRRSIGQFNHHPAICDRCFNRMPKTA